MQDLRALFESEYPGKERLFGSLIKPIFSKAKDTSLTDEQVLADSDRRQIKSFSIIAQVRGGFPIVFADVELQDTVDLKRSRVAIQNCVRKVMQDYSNAIIFFHFTDNAKEWRVSYVYRAGTNKSSTSAKRYTYLCGPEHVCRTVSERFEALKGLPLIKNEDMVEAFSVEPLSKEFFDEYKKFYEDFVQYITGNRYVKVGGKYEKKAVGKENKAIFSQFKEIAGGDYDRACKLVRDYVKKLMGRLVFLHFLQKKGWLGVSEGEPWGSGDRNFIQNLFANACDGVKDDFLSHALEPLFFRTLNTDRGKEALAPDEISAVYGWNVRIPYLNGGLFEEDELDRMRVRFKKEHFSDLLDFFSRYNFTIDESDPTDKEIGIDPEMLGKIFENLLEDNKDKGAFYTPKEIVQYMCRESLAAYLCADGGADAGKVRRILERGDSEGMGEGEKSALLGRLRAVKVCDLAVGSGAFPMGMMNELLALRSALGDTEETSEIKKQIVRDNIYGVDIEKGAVDIARLRFWLAIIVDEKEPIPLPNLDYKIMRGNSLLESFEGVDLSALTKDDGNFQFAADEIEYLLESLKTYFDKHTEKEAIRDSIKATVIDLVRNRGINASALEKLERMSLHDNGDFFLWHTWFGDVFNGKDGQDGFNIVIGNPPYIKELGNVEIFSKINDTSFGKKYHAGKMDYWFYFMHKAIELVCKNGIVSFITSRYWINSSGSKKLIKHISDEMSFINILDIGKLKVFDNVVGYHMVSILTKNTKHEKCLYCAISEEVKNIENKIFDETRFIDKACIITNNYEINLFENCLEKDSFVLNDFCNVSQGIVEASDKISSKMYQKNPNPKHYIGEGIFVLSKEERYKLNLTKEENELIELFEDDGCIARYSINYNKVRYLIYSDIKNREKIANNKNYKIIKKHLDNVSEYITSTYKPYGLHRARKKSDFEQPKIIGPSMFVNPCYAYDDRNLFVGMSYNIVTAKSKTNLFFILSLLNSRYAKYWFFKNAKHRGAGVDVGVDKLRNFPIPPATVAQQKPVIALVDKILAAKKQDPAADTSALEAQIDGLVYGLYGLTAEEIAVVEGR